MNNTQCRIGKVTSFDENGIEFESASLSPSLPPMVHCETNLYIKSVGSDIKRWAINNEGDYVFIQSKRTNNYVAALKLTTSKSREERIKEKQDEGYVLAGTVKFNPIRNKFE